MSNIILNKMTADIQGDFIVFLIGMRINKFWKLTKWVPAFLGMPKMLKELETAPSESTGYLGHTVLGFGVIVQYWRSFEQLEAYAKSPDHQHFPAWRTFNKRMKNNMGDVGVWHESYQVKAGQYETLYIGMPEYGLGKVCDLIPATRDRTTAKQRFSN